MSALFVAGTGTDIGKTHVAAGLTRALRARGVDAMPLKPVVSGYDEAHARDSDSGVLLTAAGRAIDAESIAAVSPWRFSPPLSPDMAARQEGRELRLADVAAFCHAEIVRHTGPMIIEGVGGAMSPIAEDGTCLDLARALGCPSLLVCGTYLGTISHTLTAAEAMAGRDIVLTAVVVNETPGGQEPSAVIDALRRFLPSRKLIALWRGPPRPEAFDEIVRACGLAAR